MYNNQRREQRAGGNKECIRFRDFAFFVKCPTATRERRVKKYAELIMIFHWTRTSASLHRLRNNPGHYRGAKKSNAISVSRWSRISARKVHANSALELPSGHPGRSCDCIEKERGRRKPGGDYARRKLPRRKERNSVRFFELCRHLSFSLPPFLAAYNRDRRQERKSRRRREESERTGSLTVQPVMRYTNVKPTNLHKSISTSVWANEMSNTSCSE